MGPCSSLTQSPTTLVVTRYRIPYKPHHSNDLGVLPFAKMQDAHGQSPSPGQRTPAAGVLVCNLFCASVDCTKEKVWNKRKKYGNKLVGSNMYYMRQTAGLRDLLWQTLCTSMLPEAPERLRYIIFLLLTALKCHTCIPLSQKRGKW
jgi:hypothetical protein